MEKLRKLLIVFTLLMVLVGCSQGNNKPEKEENVVNEVVETSEKVEARTAIVFKQVDNRTATVKREGEELETYEGMRLAAGDSISTDENTTVYLRVDDDKNILLDTETTMVVSELSNGKLVMYLEAGAFFFDLENKLENGEEVSFDLGGTTMSIRGTSGQGSRKNGNKSFAILTGLGMVTDSDGMEAELPPNTKVDFKVDSNDNPVSVSFNNVKSEDILDVTKNYVKDNNDYQGKVENSQWAQEVTGKSTGNSKDGSENLNNRPGRYGWIQLADGSWVFSKDAFNSKNESVPYVKPAYVPSYTPKPTPAPVPEPEPAPTPKPAPKVICEHCSKQINPGEEGLHTLIGSTEAAAYLAANYESIDLTDLELCGTHYLCELETIDQDSLLRHSVHKDGDNIVEPEHFSCDSKILHCEECGRCENQFYRYMDGSAEVVVKVKVKKYDLIDKYLCNVCLHCGKVRTETDDYSHFVFSPLGEIYVYQTYSEQLKTIGIHSEEDLHALNICDVHGICEMNLNEDISNLLNHITVMCPACEEVFCFSDTQLCPVHGLRYCPNDIKKCSVCNELFCVNCFNNFVDKDIHFVDEDGVIKHKELS